MMDKEWIDSCKILNAMSYICKQNQPILSSHFMKIVWLNCCNLEEVFPSICEKRVVEISNSLWTQLENNEWIYFVPTSESVTVLCMDKPPVDIIISGIDKKGICASCKGFGKSALFQTLS
jgi:hypothetical protein